jgi:hypothetical protein
MLQTTDLQPRQGKPVPPKAAGKLEETAGIDRRYMKAHVQKTQQRSRENSCHREQEGTPEDPNKCSSTRNMPVRDMLGRNTWFQVDRNGERTTPVENTHRAEVWRDRRRAGGMR